MKIPITLLILISLSPVLSAQSNQITKTTTKPFVLGVIDGLYSTILKEERGLNIYLPEGYDANDTVKYPVIYLLDGAADEDFIHVVGIVQFNTFPWIERIPKSIVVGIVTVDRQRDFSYPTTVKEDKEAWPATGGSEKFIAFMEKELQPYIEKTYNVNQERTLIGQSFGGLLATEIMFRKPALFSKYIIISPSLWWDDGSLLDLPSVLLDESYHQPTSIYIGYGKEGLAPGARTHVMEVDANLLAERIRATKSKHVNVYLDYLPEEDHATIGHQAVFNAFRALYPLLDKE